MVALSFPTLAKLVIKHFVKIVALIRSELQHRAGKGNKHATKGCGGGISERPNELNKRGGKRGKMGHGARTSEVAEGMVRIREERCGERGCIWDVEQGVWRDVEVACGEERTAIERNRLRG